MQCLDLQLLTDPGHPELNRPCCVWELHPAALAPSELAYRCFLGAAHTGPLLTRPEDQSGAKKKRLQLGGGATGTRQR